MHKVALGLAVIFAFLAVPASFAQTKKLIAIVVPGLDNPYWTDVGTGCNEWNSRNASSDYACYYAGPALSSDEAGQGQIVSDLLANPNVAAIVVRPSNVPLINQMVEDNRPTIPVIVLDPGKFPSVDPSQLSSEPQSVFPFRLGIQLPDALIKTIGGETFDPSMSQFGVTACPCDVAAMCDMVAMAQQSSSSSGGCAPSSCANDAVC